MKKTYYLVLLITLLIVIAGCSSGIPAKISEKEGSMTEVTQVKPSYIVELIENKETFLFYYANTWCGACQFMKSINSEVVRRKKIPIYFIEMDKTPKEQLHKIYKYTSQPQATPTYVVIIEGVVKETFTPDILVGDDTGFQEEHINLYTVNLISVLKAKGLITE